MSAQNPLWGAPRIHGGLMKLGFNVSQAMVSRCIPRRTPDPDQKWLTFLHNHLYCTASIDFRVVPTLTFKILFVLVVLSHDRRKVVHFGVTANPTVKWTAQQITEAFPWDEGPRVNGGATIVRRIRACRCDNANDVVKAAPTRRSGARLRDRRYIDR